MNYWPGTKIVKSKGNAFDWRGKESYVASDRSVRLSDVSKRKVADTSHKRSFTIYSKARREK